MKDFLTDEGTLQMMLSLTGARRCVLHGFLRRCDVQRIGGIGETTVLDGIHFSRQDIRRMRLERRTGDRRRRIHATTWFTDGATWSGGRMRLPNVVMPETMLGAMTGRRIEDIVGEAHLEGLTVHRATILKGPDLSLSTDGARPGRIPYRDDRPNRAIQIAA